MKTIPQIAQQFGLRLSLFVVFIFAIQAIAHDNQREGEGKVNINNNDRDNSRQLSDLPLSGMCGTVSLQTNCNKFSACMWTTRCQLRPTKTPTSAAPSKSPTASPSTSPTHRPSFSPSTSPTKAPTGRPTLPTPKPTPHPTTLPSRSPVTAQPTISPATPAPTAFCGYPDGSKCESLTLKATCMLYTGCNWFKNRCFRKPACPRYPTTPAPTLAPITVIQNPLCRVPTKGCGFLTASTGCKLFSGCRWVKTSCLFAGCTSEIVVTANPTTNPPSSSAPTHHPTTSTTAPTHNPADTSAPSTSPTLTPSSAPTLSSPSAGPATWTPTFSPTFSPTEKRTREPTGETVKPTPNPTGTPPSRTCDVPVGGCTAATLATCVAFDGCLVVSGACQFKPQCVNNLFTCGVKGVTFDLASTMLPACLRADSAECDRQRLDVYNGLGLQSQCGHASLIPCDKGGCTLRTDLLQKEQSDEFENFFFEFEFYVHPTFGVDDFMYQRGSKRDIPFKTLAFAVEQSRKYSPQRRQIVLMGPGVHRVTSTVTLIHEDSNLSIFGEDGAVLSGAVEATLVWRPAPTVGAGVFVANIPPSLASKLGKLSPMFVNQQPAIRARYPNLASYFDKQYAPAARLNTWRRRPRLSDPYNPINVRIVLGTFGSYTQASGGACDGMFSPPTGYFCNPNHEANGGCPYTMAGGVDLDGKIAASLRTSQWRMSDAFLHTFHPNRWGMWSFQLADPPTSAPTTQRPSQTPTTSRPSRAPTTRPSKSPITSRPSNNPTKATSRPTNSPTKLPTRLPTLQPTNPPTKAPSKSPTHLPSKSPTQIPTKRPSNSPTFRPTNSPTKQPTTLSPSNVPSHRPTTSVPSSKPTVMPTLEVTTLSPTMDNTSTSSPSVDATARVSTRGLQFEDPFAAVTGDYPLYFGSGGFQEARGDCGNGGSDWFVENALALLDSTNEYYIDLVDPTGPKVYYMPNNTNLNGPTTTVEFGVVQDIMRVQGNLATPVTNLNFRHLTFEKTYPTHMEPHEIPSGGDWSVHRGGALMLEGAVDVSIYDCKFHYLGGNGVFVSKYARDIKIQRNEFYALGSSAVLLVGDPRFNATAPYDRRLDENHVERVLVEENVANELGLAVKQSSAVFVAISRSVMIRRNVFYNIPRAGVAFNDGFGGNTTLEETVIFNSVMETLDHGPFNVWDRQQWMQNAKVNPQNYPFVVKNNLMVGNTNGAKGVDLDDGARNYAVGNNVLVYSLQKFKGNNIAVQGNLIFPAIYGCVWMTPVNLEPGGMTFTGNTCVSQNFPPYYVNLPSTSAIPLCRLKNFVAKNNQWIGTNMRNPWEACGDTVSWLSWKNTYLQDTGSQIITTMPSQPALVAMIYNKLKTIFPPAYW